MGGLARRGTINLKKNGAAQGGARKKMDFGNRFFRSFYNGRRISISGAHNSAQSSIPTSSVFNPTSSRFNAIQFNSLVQGSIQTNSALTCYIFFTLALHRPLVSEMLVEAVGASYIVGDDGLCPDNKRGRPMGRLCSSLGRTSVGVGGEVAPDAHPSLVFYTSEGAGCA